MSAATVEQTIRLYLDDLIIRDWKDRSVLTTGRVLRSFFRDDLAQPLASLYPDRARDIAAGLPDRIGKYTRRPLTKQTRRGYRAESRVFLAWCVRMHFIPANPLDQSVADDSAAER